MAKSKHEGKVVTSYHDGRIVQFKIKNGRRIWLTVPSKEYLDDQW